MIKYFDLMSNALEKADKIINERPDKLIQADITINMMEQHSVVFQNAIQKVLQKMSPEFSAFFMEELTRELGALKADEPVSIEKATEQVEKMLPAQFDEGEGSGF